ncbi:SigB/SigF/SigG family RNA polymerase sigma factor [Fannyhessea vaginae]|uniref:SigB/SigF/SigG family RNA polymerase sigma factor n=1 Tax=Fannyhessea vaginae TaxID=82135 RepID=UPI00288A1628|nr:SigB/SigF/SigG family RNA polymerase sigma factor [Fannyhessea vaginae]
MSNNEQSPRPSSRLRTQLPLKKSKHSIRDKQKTKELFKRYKETGDEQAREQLVLAHLNLARFLASKFKNRGESLDDLVQVATIGLIKAIDRFDISRGLEFTTFATPTIMGEIKRHFRDKGWSVRVPRRLQELSAKVTQVSDKLTEKLQRSPSVDEIAQALGVSVDEVLEAMESAHAYSSVSLDVPQGDDDDGTQSSTVIDKYALVDEDLESSDDRIVLEQAIKDFSEREQQIIRMRFLEGFTQVEIAQKLQISQVQVSRLLRKTLQKFQEKLDPNHVMEHADSQSS